MAFTKISMTQLGLDVVARMKREVQRHFKEASTGPDFAFDVTINSDGSGLAFVEHVDLMGAGIASSHQFELKHIVGSDRNAKFVSAGASRPTFADFRIGAMPCVWVNFKLIP